MAASIQSDVRANTGSVTAGMMPSTRRNPGVVANPIVFDETQPDLERAPELGEHTDETLLELGYDWDALIALKERGVIY